MELIGTLESKCFIVERDEVILKINKKKLTAFPASAYFFSINLVFPVSAYYLSIQYFRFQHIILVFSIYFQYFLYIYSKIPIS